jgi:outer membrane protein assembly factor BamB
MLVLISTDSVGSDHVSKEVDLAVEYGKPLLPVRIEDVMPSGTLRYLLGLAQWMDAFPGPIEDHAGEVIRRVTALLSDVATDARSSPDAADDVAVRRHGSPDRQSIRGRFRPSVLAAAGLVAVGVSIGVVWFGGGSTSSTTTVTTAVAAPTTTSLPVEESAGTVLDELWSLVLDAPVVGMATMDGLVVIATDDGLVRAVSVGFGDELWTHQAATPVQHGVFIDDGVIYYATAEGVSLLDPATGDPLEGCGFSYRGEAHGVTVADGSVYFLLRSDGTVRRVPTDPLSDGPCHSPADESAESARWPPAQSGPVVVGSELLMGDLRRLYRLDTRNLQLIDSYYLASGTPETYDGRVVGLAGAELRIQYEGGVRTDFFVYGVDGEGNLHAMVSGGSMEPTGHQIVSAPAVSELGVYLVEHDGALVALSHDLSRQRWSLRHDAAPAALWVVEDSIYVLRLDGTLTAIDAESGNEFLRLHVGEGVTAGAFIDGAVLVGTSDGSVTAAMPLSTPVPSASDLEPITRPEHPGAEAILREFYAAVSAGDRRQVESLIAVDATFGAGFEGGYWYSPETREDFWQMVEFFNALNVELLIGTCDQQIAGESVLVECDVAQSDDFLDALGLEITGSARLSVESGLIHNFIESQRVGAQSNVNPAWITYRRGLRFEVEAERLYDDFFRWAADSKADAFEVACRGDIFERATVECANFMLDHVDEYLAASQ